jgi:hypothetical protein
MTTAEVAAALLSVDSGTPGREVRRMQRSSLAYSCERLLPVDGV